MGNGKITEVDNNVTIPAYDNFSLKCCEALQIVDDVVLKNYISELSKLEIVPLNQEFLEKNIRDNVLFFKIDEMVYEKDEFALYKFASVFNSLAITNSTIFIIINSDGISTDFYMGIRSQDDVRTTSSIERTLKNALLGQFPGTKVKDYKIEEIQKILNDIRGESISAVSCVANNKEESLNKNKEFVQGLEKLVNSMKGQKYTGIIIANTTEKNQLRILRKGYECIYTQLSPFASMQVNYGKNSTSGRSQSMTRGSSKSTTETVSHANTKNITETKGSTVTHASSRENTTSKTIKEVGLVSSALGEILASVTEGKSAVIGNGLNGTLGMVGVAVSGIESESNSENKSKSIGKSSTDTESTGSMEGTSESYTNGNSITEGLTKSVVITSHDKSIEDVLKRIDRQLERMDKFENAGMYECAAYFLSDDQCTAEMAASTYCALVGGENTGVEISAVNSWGMLKKKETQIIEKYVKNFMHPVFRYEGSIGSIEVTPSTMVSGDELAIYMGLPRKSVSGFPVIEHSDFGKEVVKYDMSDTNNGVNLGNIFNMGSICPNKVFLDKESLSMHMFVTGSTGSGKSNTIYELIRSRIDVIGE